MSTIMRKPLIETIADNLDKDTLLKLNSDIDSSVGYSKYDLIEGFLPILADGQQSMTEKVTLVTNGKTLVGSYIKYDTGADIHSYLLNYGEGVHKVYIYEIDEENRTTYLVGECLGVSELRRVISERLGGGGGVSADVIRKDENGNVFVNNALEVTSDGNAVVGKNLEVDGTTKLNGGFEPIHTFILKEDDDNNLNVDVYWESTMDLSSEGQSASLYSFSGRLYGTKDGTPTDLQVLGMYALQGGEILLLNAMSQYVLGPMFLSWSDGKFTTFSYIDTQDFPVFLSANIKTIFGNQSLVGEGNIDLYRHKLTLNGSTATLKFTFEFISSKNLVCDSVADLRTLIGGTGDTFNGFYIADSSITNAPSGVAYLTVNPSVCQFYYIAKDSTTPVAPINITTVADKVTTI